jgi:outer membrane lipoprotein-sorting protein
MSFVNIRYSNKCKLGWQVVFVAVLLFLTTQPISLSAQNPKSAEIIRYFINTIKSMPGIDMEFELRTENINGSLSKAGSGSNSGTASGSSAVYKGTVNAQGDAYKLINPDLEIYCDGHSKWLVNQNDKEVIILPHDPSVTDIVENPLGFMTSVDKGYEYPFRVFSGSRSGKQIWVVELTPLNKRAAYKSISIGMEKNTYIPVMIKYVAKDNTGYTIDVKKFTKVNSLRPKEFFQLIPARLKGYEVNDMR